VVNDLRHLSIVFALCITITMLMLVMLHYTVLVLWFYVWVCFSCYHSHATVIESGNQNCLHKFFKSGNKSRVVLS